MVDAKEFRNTLGCFATGITVVTTKLDKEIHGITVNAFMSVSLIPPLILVSIDKKATAHDRLLKSPSYGVSILSQDQEAYSNHFAGMSKGFQPEFVEHEGIFLVKDALAHLVCDITDRHESGDHTLFIAQVRYVSQKDTKPLLYYRGGYRKLAEKSE